MIIVHPDGRFQVDTVEEALEIARRLAEDTRAGSELATIRKQLPPAAPVPSTSTPIPMPVYTGKDLTSYRHRHGLNYTNVGNLMGMTGQAVSTAEANPGHPLSKRMASWLHERLAMERESRGPKEERAAFPRAET